MAIKIRERKLSNGETAFYLDIYLDNERWTETIDGLRVKKDTQPKERKVIREALERIRAKRQIELIDKAYGFRTDSKNNEDFLVYFENLRDKKSPQTKEIWNNVYNYLVDYTGGRLRFKSITKSWLEGFISYLQDNVSPNSARTYYQKITAALNQAVKDEIISRNPAVAVTAPSKLEVEKNYLTIEELQIVYKAPFFDEEVKKAFLFSAYTGLRITDIKNLKWNDVSIGGDRKNKEMFLKFRQKKTSAFNYLPLNKTAISLMGKRGKPEDNLFILSKHTSSINRTFKKLFRKTGINKKISLHCARHTYATLLLSSGADLYTVSKLLGHKDIKSTQVYAKVIDRKKMEAVNNLPELPL